MLHKPTGRLFIPILAIVLSSIGLFVVIMHSYMTTNRQITTVHNTSHHTDTTGPTPVFLPTKTFTSTNLGIRFHYRDIGDEKGNIIDRVFVKEAADKIYIYTKVFNPDQGKYVEVVTKPVSQSITLAIKNQFLQGYSDQNCIITVDTLQRKYAPSTYIYATIWYINRFAVPHQCPDFIMSGNSVRYFLMDTAHPNKLLFFNLGQDNFGSGIYPDLHDPSGELTWDETIAYIN